MLEGLIEMAYDIYLNQEHPDLLKHCNNLAERILSEIQPDKQFMVEKLQDAGIEYEAAAFRAGFLSCVECIRVLQGEGTQVSGADTDDTDN